MRLSPSTDGSAPDPHRQRPSPTNADIEATWRAAGNDEALFESLWQAHGLKLLKVASAFANSRDMDRALVPALASDPGAAQVVLEYSALKGNVALFQHMLQRMQAPLLGKFLRLYAVTGGVEIWRALLAYNPDCLHWEIGEHGDALGQAVLEKDVALVRFLLEQGIDVQQSNFVGMPILPAAKSIDAGQEIVTLLTNHGAVDETMLPPSAEHNTA